MRKLDYHKPEPRVVPWRSILFALAVIFFLIGLLIGPMLWQAHQIKKGWHREMQRRRDNPGQYQMDVGELIAAVAAARKELEQDAASNKLLASQMANLPGLSLLFEKKMTLAAAEELVAKELRSGELVTLVEERQ